MKKIFTLFAASTLALAAAAQVQFANPTTPDGELIVKWDLENDTWADANDFEIDETFCFAVDVTGCPELENFLNGKSRNPAVVGRGLGFAFYSTNLLGDQPSGCANIDGRLWKIKGNIYGVIINLFQHAEARFLDGWFVPNADYTEYLATTVGVATQLNTPVFGFGWSNDNPGAEWWQFPQEGLVPFTTLPYTGTRTSKEFYKDETDDLAPEFFPGSFGDWKGYAAPSLDVWKEVVGTSGVTNIAIDNNEVVATEYFNIQGQRISDAPAAGLYIVKKTMSNGAVKAQKIIK